MFCYLYFALQVDKQSPRTTRNEGSEDKLSHENKCGKASCMQKLTVLKVE